MKAPENDRRDWTIVVAILLLGFLCIILAAGWAVRFSPRWRLDASMESMLDPNSDFLTSRPSGFVEPIDPSILTLPVWLNVFLTPGADYTTRVPPPTSTPTPVVTPVIFATATRTDIPPTSTLVYFPSPTPTNPPNPKTPVPPTITSPPPNTVVTPTITWTPSNIPPPSADLSITKTDNSTDYVGGATKTYIITVYNAGPSDVVGATVTDTFSSKLDFVVWGCTPSSSEASCAQFGSGNITDTVNLPSGSSVTYNVRAQVVSNPSGDLDNTATVTEPAGILDPNQANNSATDTDTLIVSSGTSYGQLGTGQDGNIQILNAGDSIILTLSQEINKDHPGDDLIYFEEYVSIAGGGMGIAMDRIVLEISDGFNWYTVLNWGDGQDNIGTNITFSLLSSNPMDCTDERDNCDIIDSLLYPGAQGYRSGITLDIGQMDWIPSGAYQFIRISVPPPPGDSSAGIDGIYVVP